MFWRDCCDSVGVGGPLGRNRKGIRDLKNGLVMVGCVRATVKVSIAGQNGVCPVCEASKKRIMKK